MLTDSSESKLSYIIIKNSWITYQKLSGPQPSEICCGERYWGYQLSLAWLCAFSSSISTLVPSKTCCLRLYYTSLHQIHSSEAPQHSPTERHSSVAQRKYCWERGMGGIERNPASSPVSPFSHTALPTYSSACAWSLETQPQCHKGCHSCSFCLPHP